MRSLQTAAVGLVPALATTAFGASSVPTTFISLSPPQEVEQLFRTNDFPLRFDVLESQKACGTPNVTINGLPLPVEGRGPLSLNPVVILDANWNFSCISWDDEPKEQLMSLGVDSINGIVVQDLVFTIRFSQVAPVWISDVNGAATSNAPLPVDDDFDMPFTGSEDISLEGELADIEALKRQMAELEYMIWEKEQYLLNVFGYDVGGAGTCTTFKCMIKDLFKKITGTAEVFFDEVADDENKEGHPPGHGRWRHPHWKFPHWGHKKPHCGGNHTEGNHTFPHPPHGNRTHRRPHFPPHSPPLCHCAPPPPHHQPEKPPHDGPGGPPSREPVHHPFFPSQVDEPEHPIHPDEPLPPNPAFPPDAPFPADAPIQPFSEELPPFSGGMRPPPHFPHPVKILAISLLVGLIFALVRRCCMNCKSRLRERRARRRERLMAWRARLAARRQARRQAIKDAVRGFFRTIFRRITGDEEKTAMLRQPESDSDSESNLSTTMEQEIAQFRAAANVVGELVAAEEGRSHRPLRTVRAARHHIEIATPPSPGAFGEYLSEDDVPPAYEERRRSFPLSGSGSTATSMVSDGLRYTPGSSTYTPSSSSGSERGGVNEVLGNPKRYEH